MTIRIRNTDEIFGELIHALKKNFLFGPHQRWIIGVKGCLKLDKALHFFDEGDKIVIIASETVETSACQSDFHSKNFKIWSLHSVGNGSTYFQQKNLSNILIDTGQPEEQLFDTLFTNFGGRILRISSLGSPPIQQVPLPGNPKWRGYIFRIVNTLSDIYNFTYIVKEANDRLYGMLEEAGTWNGMIGELVNKSVDMGVGDLSWTMDRSIAVDLTETIFSETVTFIYRTPGFYSRTWILFQDVDLRVWISLTFAIILGSTVYCLTLYVTDACGNEEDIVKINEELFVKSAVRSTGSIYRALLGQSIVRHPKATSCRTLLGTWFMGALILSALYGGSLTSTLSLHRSPRPADTLKELVKRYPNAILALRNNSQIHSYIKKSEVWQSIWLKNIQQNVIPGKLHIEDLMKEVHRRRPEGAPIYVWIAERLMLVKQMHFFFFFYTDVLRGCTLRQKKIRFFRLGRVYQNSPFLISSMKRSRVCNGMASCRSGARTTLIRTKVPADLQMDEKKRGEDAISQGHQGCFFVLEAGWGPGFFILVVRDVFTIVAK
ncbi:Glutamate receptor ionotropic like protein [Argiope bruennichi]|uniref:Glutamate receptor ionotropic like protein n=1 Tax=Argiope bruennichi TaxID=94029 RepID=A0A8T0FPD4_ARGBR|nr:Glutamate receptor ionotropic like protein [Argiope bruennichi]